MKNKKNKRKKESTKYAIPEFNNTVDTIVSKYITPPEIKGIAGLGNSYISQFTGFMIPGLEDKASKCIDEDIKRITTIIKKLKGNSIAIHHCHAYDSACYFSVFDGTTRFFVKSVYKIDLIGAAASLTSFECAYISQLYLIDYLEKIKKRLSKKYDIDFPIKCLYMPYIMVDLDSEPYTVGYSEYQKNIAAGYQKNFREKYSDQIAEYEKSRNKLKSYYNDEDDMIYTTALRAVVSAKREIYQNREALEACDLWQDADNTILKLNEIINSFCD